MYGAGIVRPRGNRGMTIDEAIRRLQTDIDYPGKIDIMDVQEAERLGIEALKRISKNRLVDNHPDQALLPGETEK